MKLPIEFPSNAEVIIDEVRRFRSLSPEQRVQVIRSLVAAGELAIRRSGKAAFHRDYSSQQENCARIAVKEFIARHGG